MGFIESNLLKGEEIIYRARLHPIVYAPAITLCGVGLIVLILSVVSNAPVGILLGAVALFLAAFFGLSAYIDVSTSEFAVTNRRVLIKIGWLRRKSLELLLPKVEGIAVDQSLLGRMLNFGTIGVRGTGGSREPFPNISEPLEFRRQVQELLPE